MQRPPSRKRYVNLGCGTRFHPAWINIDLGSAHPSIISHDLGRGVPLESDTCDLVYSSAVLEHFRKDAATALLRECYRVLRPGGVVRVGVPDLERIATTYLGKLNAAVAGDSAAAADYEWMMLEFYDQAVREHSGGAMLEFLRRAPENRAFILERIGMEGESLLASIAAEAEPRRSRTWTRLFPLRARRIGRALRSRLHRTVLRAVLSTEERRALEIGRFRLAGEVHQWMYDRFSLDRLLRTVGFDAVTVQPPGASRLPDFAGYELEVTSGGAVIKPDLLYMEGVKPSGGC